MLYFCLVSHGHADFLIRRTLPALAKAKIGVCVVDNLGEQSLREYCQEQRFHYVEPEQIPRGFGYNCNKGFRQLELRVGLTESDYFICCNPDVFIAPEMISDLEILLDLHKPRLAAINLYKDEALTRHDACVRPFPRIASYFARALRKGAPASNMGREVVVEPTYFDWAAGSFLVFRASFYDAMKGFDEKYFMYFEDVDICLRAWREYAERVLYFPPIKAYHEGAFNNRNLFSKHFYWYLASMFRFFCRFYLGGRIPPQSR